MITLVKNILFCILFLILFLVSTGIVQAATLTSTYGSGTYGSGRYGENSITPTPTVSLIQAVVNEVKGIFTYNATCDSLNPGTEPPSLFAATVIDSSTVELFFSPASKPFTNYSIEYGPREDSFLYNIPAFGDQDSRSITIGNLNSDSLYFFRLRSFNGCAPGPWSSLLKARTVRLGTNNYYSPAITKTTVQEKKANKKPPPITPPGKPLDNTVRLTIQTPDRKFVTKAEVTILESGEHYTTDKNGIVTIPGLSNGTHTVEVSSFNNTGRFIISVSPDTNDYVITLKKKPIPWGLYTTVTLSLIILNVLLIRFVGGKHTTMPSFRSKVQRWGKKPRKN